MKATIAIITLGLGLVAASHVDPNRYCRPCWDGILCEDPYSCDEQGIGHHHECYNEGGTWTSEIFRGPYENWDDCREYSELESCEEAPDTACGGSEELLLASMGLSSPEDLSINIEAMSLTGLTEVVDQFDRVVVSSDLSSALVLTCDGSKVLSERALTSDEVHALRAAGR